MRPHPRPLRPLAIWLAAWALAALPIATAALGRPEWAIPFLGQPTPTGGYIAKNDRWVIVYEAVTYSLAAPDRIQTRYQTILENLSDRDQVFKQVLDYDPSQYTLSDTSLTVQRKYLWHDINLSRDAAEATSKDSAKVVVVGQEPIPAHHRVVWEYTLTDKLGFAPWTGDALPEKWPVAIKHFTVEPAVAQGGLRLVVIAPGPDGSLKQDKVDSGTWEARDIPAASRLLSDLVYQPVVSNLYPYVVAHLQGQDEDWPTWAKKMADAWAKNADGTPAGPLQEKGRLLTEGIPTPLGKARALARFVQNKVLYDDRNETGVNAFLPLTPPDTLRSMKADCKGKVLLLQSLLRAVGIESVPLQLRVSERYYAWGSHPWEVGLNHVILAVKLPPRLPPLPATLLNGPAKGWLLFDPTSRETDLGQSPGGLEDLHALAIGQGCLGPFDIHTQVPAAARCDIRIEATLLPGGDMAAAVELSVNSYSALAGQLLRLSSEEKIRTAVLDQVNPVCPGAQVRSVVVTPPSESPDGLTKVKLSFLVPKAVQSLSASQLLTSPTALALSLAGYPNGLPRVSAPDSDDRVALVAPWNARLNASGESTLLTVHYGLTLPAGLTLDPPPSAAIRKPWLTYEAAWTHEGQQTWRESLSLAVPRGCWPAQDRMERLQTVDRLLAGLYGPLLLSSTGGGAGG